MLKWSLCDYGHSCIPVKAALTIIGAEVVETVAERQTATKKIIKEIEE